MTLEPLLEAPFAVQAHVATVVPAFLLGTWLVFFSRKKGYKTHRILGATFLALMIATASIALFVHLRMPNSPVFGLSPTHILVVVVLFPPRARSTVHSRETSSKHASGSPGCIRFAGHQRLCKRIPD